jgi:hypothetical protein
MYGAGPRSEVATVTATGGLVGAAGFAHPAATTAQTSNLAQRISITIDDIMDESGAVRQKHC